MIRFNEAKNPARNTRSMPESLRYTAHDVERQSGESDVDFSAYFVMRLELEPGGTQSAKLKKPLQLAFPNARVCFMTIDKRQAYAVVCQAFTNLPSHLNELEAACAALTGKPVNIGISMQGAGGEGLPVSFRQADAALEMAFFQPEANIYLYYAETCAFGGRDRDLKEVLDQMAAAVGGGETERGEDILEEVFHEQQSKLHPKEILEEGQRILDRCLEALAKAEVSRDLLGRLTARKAELKDCPIFSRYCELMRQTVVESCRGVSDKLQAGGNAVLDARNYIEKNYHLPISLGEVATAIGVNPSYLSRSYKSKMGVNLVDSINRKKISVAKELLGRGRLKISEVAQEVGIEDTAYFSHLFRRYTGMSPRSYQKLRLHGEGGEE